MVGNFRDAVGLASAKAASMKPQQEPSVREVLAGLVERVTFHNAENGFCVLRIKARGPSRPDSRSSVMPPSSPPENGSPPRRLVNDIHMASSSRRALCAPPPRLRSTASRSTLLRMIRGIGPVYARKMVKAFGEKVFDIIEAEPDRLREVTGIGAVRAKRITDACEQKIVREIMVFLHSHGVGTARAVRIFKTYGSDARPGHDGKPVSSGP